MKKIALIIAHQGYQQTEYNVPKEILEKSGFQVVTISDEPGQATAKDGSTAEVDLTINKMNVRDYDGIFVIGGPGALDCLDNSIMHSILQETEKLKKPFGAICISSRILAKAEVLKGKNATGWNGDNNLQSIFSSHGVNYISKPVVVDQNIVTATGPEAAQEFAQEIINVIQN